MCQVNRHKNVIFHRLCKPCPRGFHPKKTIILPREIPSRPLNEQRIITNPGAICLHLLCNRLSWCIHVWLPNLAIHFRNTENSLKEASAASASLASSTPVCIF